MTITTEMPKSYLSEEEREELFKEGGEELVFLTESQEAGRAGDEETAWAWLKLVEFSADTLLYLKACSGADLIRRKGLNTTNADAVYGHGWLDRNV